MASEYKKGVIHTALQVPFNEANFFKMVREILKKVPDDKRDRFDRKGAYIYNDFSPYITRFQRMGKYISPDKKRVDILIVHLKKETSLERARTMQRNFVAKYLKDDKGSGIKHAALVAFVSPNAADWRLSFVKVEYKFDDDGKPVPESSPARRYSFLIEDSSHTAQSRLLAAHTDPTLEQLEDIFSVEPVTDEFFERYRKLFLDLKELLDDIVANDQAVKGHFAMKGIDTADFAKKLLGQVIFLYFLQRKGWFGVPRGKEWGEGSKNFLRELFEKEHGEYQNFFNDILEPLFYEALSRKHTDDYYSRFDCRIPFLNGGLFDPISRYNWIDVDITLSDDIFSNSNKTGILDTFDRYNFTVNENEPLEKEVAVDPEMLGKVFEKLLPVKDRKSHGTYYTPRDIVHYMCQESLANYLMTELKGKVAKVNIEKLIKHGEDVAENEIRVAGKGRETKDYSYELHESVRKNAKLIDTKLASIRICDPAAGSGAFLVGMMNEIVRARNALTPHINNNGVERLPYDFKRQAIENGLYGVDIDSSATEIAKLRLWLSLIVDERDRNVIKPLPNLDYRVVQGNSLLGMENFLCDPRKAEELKELQRRNVRETNPDERRNIQIQIKALRYEIDSVQDSDFGVEFSFKRHFLEVFDDKGGFDVVIGNPPYKSAPRMQKDDPEERRQIKKSLSGYPFLHKRWDLFVAFIAKGHQILSTDGNLAYIVPNPILKEQYALKLRRYLLEQTTLKSILAFNDVNVFKKVSRRTTVFVSLKTRPKGHYAIPIFGNDGDSIKLTNEVNSEDWLNEPRHIFSIGGNTAETELLNKIDSKSSKVGNYFYVSYGARVSSKKRGKFLKKDVVSNTPRGNAKRFFEGKDVQRWRVGHRKLWLDYRENEMYSPQFPELFEENKVVVRKVSDKTHRLAVALDQTGSYTDDGNTLIAPYIVAERAGLSVNPKGFKISKAKLDLKYALALLLSSLETFYFRGRFATESLQGASSHTYPNSVKGLPIVELPPDEQKPFIEIVDKILAITGTDDYLQNPTKQAQVCAYEKDIDKLVYDLYDLTPNEIKIIEEGNNPK